MHCRVRACSSPRPLLRTPGRLLRCRQGLRLLRCRQSLNPERMSGLVVPWECSRKRLLSIVGPSRYLDVYFNTQVRNGQAEWKNPASVVAIDSSGLTPDSASTYYSVRTGKARHDYLKTTISVDTTYKSLISFNITNSRCHDSQVDPVILRASHRVRKYSCYVIDKAYDSERIHRFTRICNVNR
jgi:hypothetical protein